MWLLLVLCGGCPTRHPEGSFHDAAPHDDAPGDCIAHTLEVAPLASLDLVDGPGPYPFGVSARVRAGVSIRAGCDVLGQIDVDVQLGNATDSVTLTAHVWRATVCPASETTITTRIIPLPSDNVMVTVHDANSTLSTGWSIVIPAGGPPTMCQPRMIGSPCSSDCDCTIFDERARCILFAAGNTTECVRSCSEDVDCDASEPHCDSMSWSCDKAATCGECPFGQTCGENVACVPIGQIPGGGACSCDADCDAARLCDETQHMCQLPCGSNDDCPVSSGCVSSVCVTKI
jgi:hypothetical protein